MTFIHVAGLYLNLDHVAFVRTEEHPHLGHVVAIHFTIPYRDPVYVSDDHLDEIGRLLARGQLLVEDAEEPASTASVR